MVNDKDDVMDSATKQEHWPLDTLAIVTCGQCGHSWAAKGKQVTTLKEGESLTCPQCHHEASLDQDQRADLTAHLTHVDKVTGKGSTWVTIAALAAFFGGYWQFLGPSAYRSCRDSHDPSGVGDGVLFLRSEKDQTRPVGVNVV